MNDDYDDECGDEDTTDYETVEDEIRRMVDFMLFVCWSCPHNNGSEQPVHGADTHYTEVHVCTAQLNKIDQ